MDKCRDAACIHCAHIQLKYNTMYTLFLSIHIKSCYYSTWYPHWAAKTVTKFLLLMIHLISLICPAENTGSTIHFHIYFSLSVCVCPLHGLSPCHGGEVHMFQWDTKLCHLESCTPCTVTLGEQVCGEDLNRAWPNHLLSGEKWMWVWDITLGGATPSTSSLPGCNGFPPLPVSISLSSWH